MVSPPVVSPPVTEPSPASITITVANFHPGEVGLAYAPVGVLVSGGTQPYRFSLAAGTLPAGLSLSVVGVTSGTPTAVGKSSFVVRATDANGATATISRSITVVQKLTLRGFCVEACFVEQGCLNVCGGFGAQTGGVGPYKYALITGTVPQGMALSGLALTGPMRGIQCDCQYDEINITVRVTDALGAIGTVNASFAVFSHIGFAVSGVSCVGYGCSADLPYFLGTPGGSVNAVVTNATCADPPCSGTGGEPPVNTLPDQFTITVDQVNQIVTVTFPSPGNGANWFGTIVVTITDQSICGAGGALCSDAQIVTVDSNTKYG